MSDIEAPDISKPSSKKPPLNIDKICRKMGSWDVPYKREAPLPGPQAPPSRAGIFGRGPGRIDYREPKRIQMCHAWAPFGPKTEIKRAEAQKVAIPKKSFFIKKKEPKKVKKWRRIISQEEYEARKLKKK